MLITTKDTLLPNIQAIMKETAIRREVEAATNKTFGIFSPKQLPHEKLNEYRTTLANNIETALKKNNVINETLVDASKSASWNKDEGWFSDFEHHLRKKLGHKGNIKWANVHIIKAKNKSPEEAAKHYHKNISETTCYTVKRKKMNEGDNDSGVAKLNPVPETGINAIPSAIKGAVDNISQGGIKGLANKVGTGIGMAAKDVGDAAAGASDYLNKKIDSVVSGNNDTPKMTNLQKTLASVKAEKDTDTAKGKSDKPAPVSMPSAKPSIDYNKEPGNVGYGSRKNSGVTPPADLVAKLKTQYAANATDNHALNKSAPLPDYAKVGVHPSKDQPASGTPSIQHPVSKPTPTPIDHPSRGSPDMSNPPIPKVRPSTDKDFNTAFGAARERGDKSFQWKNAKTGKVGTFAVKVKK